MYTIVFTATFEKLVKKFKKKHPQVFEEMLKKLTKLEKTPELGKPLQYGLSGYRRMHVLGSFVLVYEIKEHEVRLLDLDHHDTIYER